MNRKRSIENEQRTSLRRTLVAIISVFSAFVLTRAALLPYRAKTDESPFRWDIADVVLNGELSQPANYNVGNAFQIISGTIIKITGLEYRSLDLLSPVIGIVSFAVILIFCVSLYQRYALTPSQWGVFAIAGSIIVFAGFVNRLTETTHKKYTFMLVFALIYILVRNVETNSDSQPGKSHRFRILFLVFGMGVAFYNHIWAIVYVGAVTISLISTSNYLKRDTPLLLAMMFAFVLPNYISTLGFNRTWVNSFILSIISIFSGQLGATETPNTGGSAGFLLWGIVDFGGISVPIWFFYASGIIIVALLAIVNAGRIMTVVFHSRSLSPIRSQNRLKGLDVISSIVLPMSLWIGLFVAAIGISGGFATVKRLVVVPGVIGVLSFIIYLSHTGNDGRSHRFHPTRKQLLVILSIILVCTSMFAVPRMVLNGGNAPYDFYGSDSEVEQWDWYKLHRSEWSDSTCSVEQPQIAELIGSKLVQGTIPTGESLDRPYSTVYSSGSSSRFYC